MSDIRFDAVSRVFTRENKDFLTLEKIDLHVRDGEFVAIVGPSGCGKTTCLRMVAGLEFPSEGRVSVGDKEITQPGPERAVVFQQFALFPWKTVHQNLEFGLRAKGVPASQRGEIIDRNIKLMNLAGYEKCLSSPAVGRHAAARGDRACLCARSGRAAHG